MSEPSPSPPLVRAVDADGFSNPILYIEELRRLPLARSRVPGPGTTLVFRARNGRLRAPAGGYTAGEMFFLGPLTSYQIDTSPHPFTAAFEVGPSLLVGVAGYWTITDPIAVVAHRVSDLEHACTTELRDRIAAALPSDVESPETARERLRAVWPKGVYVPGGVRLEGLRIDAARTDALTGERLIHFLLADDEESDPDDLGGADPGQLVQELRSLARDGLAEHGSNGAVGRALVRFYELVSRIGDVLPDERAGDDRGR